MALARFERDFTDEDGNLLTGSVSVEVRNEVTGRLPQLYSDRAGTVSIGNPATFADGKVAFHVAGGAYKVTATQGSFSRQLRYVGVGLAGETDFSVALPAGAWDAEGVYQTGSLVSHEGYVFLSRVDENEANEPDSTTPGDTTEWMLVPTIEGEDAFVYIAYASAGDGTGFSLVPSNSLTYMAVLSTDTEIETPVAGDFAGLWRLTKGDPGTPGEPLILDLQPEGGVVTGRYVITDSYHGTASMDFWRVRLGSGAGFAYVYLNDAEVYGPLAISSAAPVEVTDLGLVLAVGDVVELEIEATTAITDLYSQMDGRS